jgi:hypothetical protein
MNPEMQLAQTISMALSGTVIPIVILWLKRLSWPSYYKFGLAVALSVILATLTAYVEGQLTPTSMAQNFLTIFAISQGVYQTFFKALNLHAFIYPEDVVASHAKLITMQNMEPVLTKEIAQNILRHDKPEQLVIEVGIQKAEG